jgi:EmrB/QacA subfamily drug resistance transporter
MSGSDRGPGAREGGAGGRLIDGRMLGLASGAILVPLNSTMLAVALPSIMTEFGVGAADVASLVTLYLGAVAIALPASGTLGDRFGHRRVFLVGVVAFALASTLAAVAPAFAILALSRVLQAVSGALVSTSSVALLRAMAAAERRGATFGVFDMLVSTSAAIGPLLGGLLVAGFGWRSLFVVAVPVAVLAAVAVGRAAPVPGEVAGRASAGGARPRRLDVPGLVLLGLVVAPLLAGLRGLEDGGTAALGLVAAPVVLVVFVLFELRTADPAVDPRLFARRAYTGAVLGVLGATVILHATLVLVPLLVQEVQGAGAQVSGFVLLGISALGAVAAPFGGRISDVVGRRRPAVIGMLVTAAGLLALWGVAVAAGPIVLGALLGLVGFGMGMTGSPRTTAALETIEPERVGMAAGTYLTGRYIGGALGATLAGAVLGETVTAAGVTEGFAVLTIVALGVAGVSMLLPGRRQVPSEEARPIVAATAIRSTPPDARG